MHADRRGYTAVSSPLNEINVTPMIDVLLVLLIMFMFMVPMMRRAVDVQLPEQTPTGGTADGPSIVLEVGPSGYTINGRPVAPGGLDRRLQEIYDDRPEKVLWVKGDPRITYQRVIETMDVARGAGVLVLGLPPKSP